MEKYHPFMDFVDLEKNFLNDMLINTDHQDEFET